MMFEIRCLVCDSLFYPGEGRGQRRKYCSPECQRIGKNRSAALGRVQAAKERKAEKQRIKRLQAEKEKNSIIEICLKAKEAGMSYGEYVSKFNIR